MKTRLEQQIEKMQNELTETVNFANVQQAKFIKDLNKHIIPILSKYKKGVFNPTENTYVDKGITGNLYYRVHLKVDLRSLSKKQLINIETALKTEGVPMPCAAVQSNSISLVYYNS